MANPLKTLCLLGLLALTPVKIAHADSNSLNSYQNRTDAALTNYSNKHSKSATPAGAVFDVDKSTYSVEASTPVAISPKKESGLIKFLKRFELGASYGIKYHSTNPTQTYFDAVNQQYKDGYYTGREKLVDFTGIQTTAMIENPAEARLSFDCGKGIKIGAIGANSSSKTEVNYSGVHYFYSAVYGTNRPCEIRRNETIETKTNSIGASISVDLNDRFSLELSGTQDNYDINGKAKHEFRNIDSGVIQYRDINYSGTGTGNTIEAGIKTHITKNIAFKLTGGQSKANFSTKGTQKTTQTSNPGLVITKDYSPYGELNSTFGKASIEISF